jgi:class 3 adenylate cyclase
MEARTCDCTVLIVDIAGSVALRTKAGEAEAGRIIQSLIQDMIDVARSRSGFFIKSYGDDVLATFEGPDQAANAAQSAIEAQRLAEKAGLQLYAGLYAGPVEFNETMGHPTATGQAVNLAARLHKLTEDAPGRIFVSADFVKMLPDEFKREASPFGMRQIKGFGALDVWTIAWRERPITVTVLSTGRTSPAGSPPLGEHRLTLTHGANVRNLTMDDGPCVLGRAAECGLLIPDPEPRISSRHLIVEFTVGLWMAHDISRNGSWMRDLRNNEIVALRPGAKAQLPPRGQLCLGRPFSEDPAGAYTVSFEGS